MRHIRNIAVMALMMACNMEHSMAQGLSRKQAQQVQAELVDEWMTEMRRKTEGIGTNQSVQRDDRTMPLHWQVFGEKPTGGYSLYISLHGGGNTAHQVNDSQWRNQWRLYAPQGAVYVCPRAPYDDWDMHFKPGLDEFYRDIILYAVTHLGVNANRVYVMGYSAGGDGVWRLAPRMADTWAAASMMAGHPGDVSLLNLRNTPFMVWCGALDAAYDRNKRCAERIQELDSLQHATPGGYVHEGHIVEGMGHWMEQTDTAAVSWMARHERNPYPHDIVWRQEEVLHHDFYWISVPDNEMQRGREVRLHVKGNGIYIERCDYRRIALGLADELVNLDKPVSIYLDGKRIMKRKLERSRDTMDKWLRLKGDPNYACPAEVVLDLK